MVTCPMEMLELLDFRHMTAPTVWFESRDEILLVRSWKIIMTSNHLFQNTFILTRPRVANFVHIIKIATMFLKTTFKAQTKLKELKIMY